MSVDTPEESRAVVAELALPFSILADVERRVVASYGLAHEGGGLEGETIAIPAEILVRPDGSIAWQHRARLITERASPAEVLAEVEKLTPAAMPSTAR